jgi:hypothetical protein
MANDLRTSMNVALNAIVVPVLRERGFKGSLPHLRRLKSASVELLTFQFDKWGGGFVVEIARCSSAGFTTAWGKHIPADKLSAHDVHPENRVRIQPATGGGRDAWFRFDDGNVSRTAQEFLNHLAVAESWYEEGD